MQNIGPIKQLIRQQALVPLFYHSDISTCLSIAHACYSAGIRAIEFTNRGKKARENFALLSNEKSKSMPGMALGAGTIGDKNEAADFLDAGADFLVSPFFDRGICEEAKLRETLWIPGCMTPTEIHRAQSMGCGMVKLFPGNLLGPGFLKSVMPLFASMEFIVTGGVGGTEENFRDWFRAGVSAIGMGSGLISEEMLRAQDFEGLAANTKEALQWAQDAKKSYKNKIGWRR